MIREIIWMLRHTKRSLRPKECLCSTKKTILRWHRFWTSYYLYNKLAEADTSCLSLKDLHPCLGNDTAETKIEPVYFYQDTWAFEKIVKASPSRHVDVGSHHKFVAFLSKVLPVSMIDIRPLSLSLKTLEFQKGSILDLPFPDKSVESVSSLCVAEHIGLGRYGDSLDPLGSEKAIAELCRVVSPNGDLYISVPINNSNRVFFNAHRAFEEEYLEKLLSPLKIVDRKYIYKDALLMDKPDDFSIGLYHAVRETA